jgi:hypothetical protein
MSWSMQSTSIPVVPYTALITILTISSKGVAGSFLVHFCQKDHVYISDPRDICGKDMFLIDEYIHITLSHLKRGRRTIPMTSFQQLIRTETLQLFILNSGKRLNFYIDPNINLVRFLHVTIVICAFPMSGHAFTRYMHDMERFCCLTKYTSVSTINFKSRILCRHRTISLV